MRWMAVVLIAGMALTGCASTGDKTKKGAAGGAILGGILGGILGYQQDQSGGALKGALIGAGIGGLSGAAAGAYMDKQQAEFEEALASERATNQIEIERLQNENLKITMNSEVSFDFNSTSVKPSFENTLNKVSGIVDRYDRTHLVIVGHTDDVGPSSYNQTLSEQRAGSVKHYLSSNGISTGRVATEGRGEMEPRASNASEAGRQLNRRVEILIVPNDDAGVDASATP